MNERIMKLFDQATFDESRVVDGVYHPYIPLQFYGEPLRLSITREQYHKFAELIIRKCVEQVEQAKHSPFVSLDDAKRMQHFVNVTKKKITKHFGIEDK